MARRNSRAESDGASERTPLLHEVPPEPLPEDSQQDVERNEVDHVDTPLAQDLSTGKLILTLGSIWVGVFLNALDSTIVATLSAPISASFNSFRLLSWLASSYLIANAALQPLSGRLTDIFSRRTGLLFSNLFFGVGTLICGLAKTEGMMIAGRVIAGMGGGGLNSISTFVASDLIPLRQRGLWQGVGNICFGVGSGVGGIFGGWIHDTLGWRWAFLIQLPFIVVSGLLVALTVHIPVKEKNKSKLKRVDFLGAFLLVATLVLLLVALNSGGNLVPWSHPLVITSLVLSAVTFLAFVYVEDQIASEPVIPVRLCLDRTVMAACLANWFECMAVYGILYFGPIYFQARGFSVTQAGARITPYAVGVAIGSIGSGYVMRATGRYRFLNLITGGIFLAAVSLVAATFDLHTPTWTPFVYFFFAGLAYASMLTITLVALIAAVDHIYQAVITSASYAFRSTGSTIGITICSAVFQNLLKQRLWDRFGAEPHAADRIARLRDNIDEIKSVPDEWRHGVLLSYMEALRGVWVTVLGLAVLGVGASLFMREHVLHKNLQRK